MRAKLPRGVDGRDVPVSVADHGRAIREEDRKKIFRRVPAGRTAPSTKTKGGTASGWRSPNGSLRCTAAHLGRVHRRKGLDFLFQRSGAGQSARRSIMSKRVLVVEDQEDNRKIVRDLLVASGTKLVEATTGEEGLALAERERPDLILMDIPVAGAGWV